jgi:hypothetical protein
VEASVGCSKDRAVDLGLGGTAEVRVSQEQADEVDRLLTEPWTIG